MLTTNDVLATFGIYPEKPLSARWDRLIKLSAMVLLAQALFWGLFYVPWGGKPQTRNIDRIAFTSATLAELSEPTPAAADAAPHNKVNLPYVDCCDPAYLSLKLNFNMDEIPPSGLGLIASQQVDNFVYRLNGSIIHQRGRMEFGKQTFDGQRPYLLHLPEGLLKKGENELSIITVRHGFPYTDLFEPLMGEYGEVQKMTALRFWQTLDYRLLGGALTFILGLLALIMVFRSEEKIFAAWLLVLCWAWSLYAVYGLWFNLPFGGTGRMVIFFVTTSLVTISLNGFIDTWTRRPLYWAQIGLIAAWVIYSLFSIYALNFVPMPQGFDLMDVTSQWFALIGGALVIARLLWHFGTQSEDRMIEAALLSICAVCLALDGIGAKFGMNPGGYLMESAAVLLLAFVIAFLQRNFHLFQSALAFNRTLEVNLKKREAELAVVYARERQLTDQQARSEERRRLMRDMHDGVGGQLVGMLLEVRRGAIDSQRMADGLQVAMDEIRLMIDSVDAAGTTLETMLAVFESRVRPRVQGAGLEFNWSVALEDDVDLPPPTVLQIFRIMQESVTNAIKHSQAKTIAVRVRAHADSQLVIAITDNGVGLPEEGDEPTPRPGGHGLSNMRNRAATIGAQLSWQDVAPGTRVTLRVPLGSHVFRPEAVKAYAY